MRRDAVSGTRGHTDGGRGPTTDEMGLPVPVIRKSAVDSLVARVAEHD
jgi:hypothetical protein